MRSLIFCSSKISCPKTGLKLKGRGEISGNVEKEKPKGESWKKKKRKHLRRSGRKKIDFLLRTRSKNVSNTHSLVNNFLSCLNCFGLCSTTIVRSLYYSLFSAVFIIFPAVPYSSHRINVSAYRNLFTVSASVSISNFIYSEQQFQTRFGNQVLPLHNQE